MVNGRRYIGQRKFTQGWKSYLGSGKAFKEAVNKYGRKNFIRDIVYIAYSEEELDNKEIEWIKNYNAVNDRNFYNIVGGGKGFTGYIHSCKAIVCLNNSMYFMGTKSAGEYVNKDQSSISYNISGKTSYCGVLENGEKAVWSTYEDYINMSKEDINSKITKANNIRKPSDNYNAKKVICITTNKVFNSITEGAYYYNCLRSHVSNCCNHKRKHCGKLKDGTRLAWMYYDEFVALKEVIV